MLFDLRSFILIAVIVVEDILIKDVLRLIQNDRDAVLYLRGFCTAG